ncbi:interleukin-1 receptor type 2 isoform X2 [Xenopus laevis]|uniref:Interleukin-1 receptor type 2 isoform X2 n=1 Tax=Xenopus laevis TaxID=8355 RepID=A0A8J1M9M1_XENLA|nr:interleukin-1 receptor type 2 isoform X2 [Xenopus laevis]
MKHFIYLKMKHVVVITMCILQTMAFAIPDSGKEEKCQEQITHFMGHYVLNGQPAVIKCPALQYLQMDFARMSPFSFNLAWTKNTFEYLYAGRESRIHPKEESLWFFPALIEDTGMYSCILRNSSLCIEVTLSLMVIKEEEVHIPDIAYEQLAFEHSQFQMFCPDLSDFTINRTDVQVQWYKDGEPMENDIKYMYSHGTTYIHIIEIVKDDEGYYTCKLQFTHENTQYVVSRTIHLRTVGKEKMHHPVIQYPNHKPIAAALDTKLVIPCKVYTGNGGDNSIVWWSANDSYIDEFFSDGRVTEGTFQEKTESDGHYIEVSLIFENVKEEDFNTEFKCIASNDYGSQVLPTQIQRAASAFTWYIPVVPAVLVCLIIALVVTHKYRKAANKKEYSLTKS